MITSPGGLVGSYAHSQPASNYLAWLKLNKRHTNVLNYKK